MFLTAAAVKRLCRKKREKMSNDQFPMSNKIDKAISILIKAIIFLLPLFFLPWTSEYFEFNKQFLLWLAMPAALFLWLIKQAGQKQLKIKTNPLNFPVLIFLALTFISSIFSLDRFSSFFGYFGRFSDDCSATSNRL